MRKDINMRELYDVIIIGSGPAGLGAAIYAQRARLKMLVIESNYVSGGQIINTYEVDNYPGLQGINGMDLGMKLREHAEKMGAQFVRDTVVEILTEGPVKTVKTEKKEFESRTVIIATGAKHRKLGLDREEELTGLGVSYCATCDGAFFKNRAVAVVGGGDVAVEDAIFLARGCSKVYVIHRRDKLRAAQVLQDNLLAKDNVEMLWDSVVESIGGDQQVESITVRNKKDGSCQTIPVAGIFIAVGIIPNSDLLKGKVEMDESGYIIAGEDGATSEPGIYAAGDIRTKMLRQVVTAVSDGANCVTALQTYLLDS